MDECFTARMDILRDRFPLQEFREQFVKEFARTGIVYIQTIAAKYDGMQMLLSKEHGFIFSSQRHIDTAIALLKRWGFVVEIFYDHHLKLSPAYAVMLPEAYLRNKISIAKIGMRRTDLRRERQWGPNKQTDTSKEPYFII